MVREATQWEREEMEKVVRAFSCSRICPWQSPEENATDCPCPVSAGGFGPSFSLALLGCSSCSLALRCLPRSFSGGPPLLVTAWLPAGSFWPSCSSES